MPSRLLIELDRCRLGEGTFVTRYDREFAVIRLAEPDRVFVIDNACPHAGGNLAGGDVTGEIVTCPWHHWKFELRTGICTHSALAKVRSYPVEIRDGNIWIDLPKD